MNKVRVKIFISHSWEDNEISRKLAEYLKRDGADVWIDYARIEGGDSLPEVISKAIDWCDTLVLVWSKSAVDSYWVKEEWTCAHSLRKRIIPCLIDDSKLPSILLSKLYIDFSNFVKGYPNLAKALKLGDKVIRSKAKIVFRCNPLALSQDEVNSILKRYNFFDFTKNRYGNGFDNIFNKQNIKGDMIIVDKASNLIWQQSGSDKPMNFEKAKEWIKKLNNRSFAGFIAWRLPTLEEAMSLMEPEKMNDLYIDSIFDTEQFWIWTADQLREESWMSALVVDFYGGSCYERSFDYNDKYVRAVRSG